MKMTLGQHIDFADKVNQFRELLMQPHIMCVGNRSSPESRAVDATLRKLDHLKNKMDNVGCRDFPKLINVTGIYYGPSKTKDT